MRALTRIAAASSALTPAAAGLIAGATAGTAYASTCSQSYLPLPDPVCSPGSYNPDAAASAVAAADRFPFRR